MLAHRPWLYAAFVAVLAGVCVPDIHAVQADFAAAVIATHPIAYYPLDATSGKSAAGVSTYAAKGGVGIGSPGAAISGSSGKFTQFDGKSGYILTTQKGGVGQSASIMAWVNLSELPRQANHYFYVAGESENGNDLDLQFESDNVLRFFTASGGNLPYTPAPASLVNQWHMILVTMDLATRTRAMYWDGKLVAHDSGGGEAGKKSALSIGASTVFSGRWFHGGIEEVALWDHALKAADVTSIYAAANFTASGAAAAPAGAGANMPASGPFASKATVEIEDHKGPVKLKREEQIAYMFMSAIEVIEHNCQLTLQHTCTMDQMLSGSYPAGSHIERLKFDPNKTDPNYIYTLGAGGMAWEAHANAKKPGLIGFCFMARDVGTTTVTYSTAGKAGWVDTEIGNRGMSGDSFASQ
jgi:hypothetical protein